MGKGGRGGIGTSCKRSAVVIDLRGDRGPEKTKKRKEKKH